MKSQPLDINIRWPSLRRWGAPLAIAPLLWLCQAAPATPIPATTAAKPPAFLRPKTVCPTEVQPLTAALLRDLPSYLNRQSHQRAGSQAGRYALFANQADFRPLPVRTSHPNPDTGGLHQIFFTLLERQYDTRQATEYQTYHWLFLAHTADTGWNLAILYSREAPYPSTNQAPSPLQDATRLATGRAIRQWLRDCQAGAVTLP